MPKMIDADVLKAQIRNLIEKEFPNGTDENTDVQKKPYLLFPYDVKTDGNEEFMFEHFKFRFDYERMKRLKEIEHL